MSGTGDGQASPRDWLWYALGVLLTPTVLALAGLTPRQTFAVAGFSVILFGAMIIHYIFDIADDLLSLGYINSNWKRWGRDK